MTYLYVGLLKTKLFVKKIILLLIILGRGEKPAAVSAAAQSRLGRLAGEFLL